MGLEYVVIIYAAGLILLITEVFVPGGLLGIAGAIGLSISILVTIGKDSAYELFTVMSNRANPADR